MFVRRDEHRHAVRYLLVGLADLRAAAHFNEDVHAGGARVGQAGFHLHQGTSHHGVREADLAKAGRHAGALGPLVGQHGSGFVNPLHDGACGHAAAGAVGRGFCHKTQDGRGGGHGLLRGHAGPQKFFMRPIIHESRDRVAAVARLNVTVCRGEAARRTGSLASVAGLVCYCIDS